MRLKPGQEDQRISTYQQQHSQGQTLLSGSQGNQENSKRQSPFWIKQNNVCTGTQGSRYLGPGGDSSGICVFALSLRWEHLYILVSLFCNLEIQLGTVKLPGEEVVIQGGVGALNGGLLLCCLEDLGYYSVSLPGLTAL